MKRHLLFLLLLMIPALSFADLAPLEITEEDGAPSTFPNVVKFSNGTVTENVDGTTSVSTVGGNSFETLSVPAGTNPVADSSTDTLTITEAAGLDITGT